MSSETSTPYITLVGCGKMGSALLAGWLKTSPDKTYAVIDPQGLPESLQTHQKQGNIVVFTSAEEYSSVISETRMVVLAVKPQILGTVCQSLQSLMPPKAIIVSIAAGKTLSSITGFFNKTQPVVRAMPNTPASIGCGITAAIANEYCAGAHKDAAEKALQAGGIVEWINDESLMNAVTAISGSGPAYFYRFTEALAQAGMSLGLEKELALILARQTFEGSAALSKSAPDISVSRLRDNVTSPGGTTEAALKAMDQDNGLQKIIDKAVEAACARGNELDV